MNRLRILAMLVCALCYLITAGTSAQDNYTYYSYPNLPIPYEGDPGLWDTISVPIDIVIEDANFYVGIETFDDLAGIYIITVTSPSGQEVTLHNHNQHRILPKWFDTEQEEDGPGDLDNYIGYNAHGLWSMFIERYADRYPFIWNSWAIEVIGQATGANEAEIPLVTGLGDSYPNPFNSTTVINYSLAGPGQVTFKIYDVLGAVVRLYEIDQQNGGRYQLKWDGCNSSGEPVASGIYMLRMVVTENERPRAFTRKLTLLK